MAGTVTVRELVTKWGFEVDDTALEKLDSNLESLGKTVKLVGAAAISAAAAMFGLAASSAAAGDDIAKTADKFGVGIEDLQKWRFSADLAGVATSEFDNSLLRLTRNLADADNDMGAAKDTFKELGIQITDSNGKIRPSTEVMAELADKFKDIEDPTKKAGIAIKLFGRSGAGMVNLLNQGSNALAMQRKELTDLGGVMSTEAVRNSEKFIDAQTKVKALFGGLTDVVGSELIPVFTELFDKLTKWAKANREVIKSNLSKFIARLIKRLKLFLKWGKSLLVFFQKLTKSLGGVDKVLKTLLYSFGLFAALRVLTTIGLATQAFIALAKGILFANKATLLLNAKALLIPVLIGLAIAAAVIIIQDFITFMQGGESFAGDFIKKMGIDPEMVRNRVRVIWGVMTNFFSLVKSGFASLFNFIVSVFIIEGYINKLNFIGKAIARLFTSILEYLGIKTEIEAFANAVKDIFVSISMLAIAQFTDLSLAVQSIFNSLVSFSIGLFTDFSGTIIGVFTNLFSFITPLFTDFSATVSGVFAEIASFFTWLMSETSGKYAVLVDNVIQSVVNFGVVIKDIFLKVIGALGDLINSAFPGFTAALAQTWTDIVSFSQSVIGVFTQMKEYILSLFSGIGDYISGLFTDIVGSIKSKVNAVKDFFGFGDDTDISVKSAENVLDSARLAADMPIVGTPPKIVPPTFAAPTFGSGGAQVKNDYNLKNEVNISTTNLSSDKAAEAVESGTKEAVESILREAREQGQPSIAY